MRTSRSIFDSEEKSDERSSGRVHKSLKYIKRSQSALFDLIQSLSLSFSLSLCLSLSRSLSLFLSFSLGLSLFHLSLIHTLSLTLSFLGICFDDSPTVAKPEEKNTSQKFTLTRRNSVQKSGGGWREWKRGFNLPRSPPPPPQPAVLLLFFPLITLSGLSPSKYLTSPSFTPTLLALIED